MSQAHRDSVLAAANLILAAAKTLDRVCRHDAELHKQIDDVPFLQWLETIAFKLEAIAQQKSAFHKEKT